MSDEIKGKQIRTANGALVSKPPAPQMATALLGAVVPKPPAPQMIAISAGQAVPAPPTSLAASPQNSGGEKQGIPVQPPPPPPPPQPPQKP